jgi:hypothetical protein
MTSPRTAACLAVLALALGTTACVPSRQPPTTVVQSSVEERKREVAQMRDRGVITYEEAARRQFAIQRNAYALSDGEMSFWRASIEYAMQVDRGRLTRDQYFRLVARAHDQYVVASGQARG